MAKRLTFRGETTRGEHVIGAKRPGFGELSYLYVFYTVVIVTFIYTIYFTRRNYYGGGLTFLSH